ncbi:hypothetical protein [Flavobacterium sp.]|uniref:hypothetical protein n=1 Tax=Flavobacterium sp. TaxID=239 RepID=UPI002B4B7B63|nr:hypothetical protein [Flavobacterium sp.]HLP64316.1 hypothetical protein [Flavobacterium sp.]
MIKIQKITIGLVFGFLFFLLSCSSSDEEYIDLPNVSVDLTQVPYPKLSDYHFFTGELKNLTPNNGVILYQPATELFTDYAEKKRFVWMPNGAKATYVNDHSVLDLPVGAVVIKMFYYTNVQPANTTKIIETRMMIRKSTGWIFAEYIWNDEQTEAYIETQSTTRVISWKDSNNVIHTIDYRTPEVDFECLRCHAKFNNTIISPIGIKPQNINYNLTYAEGSKNQLTKLIETGYLDNNLPSNINSTVNFKDTSKSLDLRVRSYFDANCAHCHIDGGEPSWMNLRFAFNETVNPMKMGVMAHAAHYLEGYNSITVTPGNVGQSILHYRVNTENDLLYIMPPLGRTKRHTEAVQLIENWINSL